MIRLLRILAVATLVAAAASVFLVALTAGGHGGAVVRPPDELLAAYRERGVKEIGAINLVSAIYLGYRVYDTLGETLVLVLAVTGVSAVIGHRHGPDGR